ncbi:uncharacterized protein FSUBG_4133 [Fusarium subglutinans]|uniref:Xylanolytic transcriptional activator regulatory domain-containing protein n=1 Tax=Gibberella subglutinans TaxID=42677 RepID=A0A8H5Q4F5_GIBSU|nr:uncharacterized protein FSUBG_4133 [Fusarium subglutinans]KAF5609340.1 hypothetical protein FSUBG_4133 [Fusarium subglutinans]
MRPIEAQLQSMRATGRRMRVSKLTTEATRSEDKPCCHVGNPSSSTGKMITQSGLPDIVLNDPASLGDEAGLDMDWNQGAADMNQSTAYECSSNGIPFIQQTTTPYQQEPFMMGDLMSLGQFEQLPPRHLTDRLRYAEADEMKGRGEYFTTIAHAQCWCLISAYESHQLLFSRASVSLSKSVRIAQMLGLHRSDSQKQPTDPPLPPPRNLFEVEERRRTWWVIFCSDRFVSGITGWPALVNEKDIETRLPASDDAFDKGTDEAAPWFADALQGVILYSAFAGKVLTAQNLRLPQCGSNRNAIVVNSTDDAEGAMADHFLVFSAYLAALIFPEGYMETNLLKTEQNLHYILNAMAQAGEKDLFSRSLAIQLASGMKHVGMDSRTIDKVQHLPPTPVSIPILVKQDKASSHITFCSILPTKSDDYWI